MSTDERIEIYKQLIIDCGIQCEQAMKDQDKFFAQVFSDLAINHSYGIDINKRSR